jgi:hypothetical protein
MKHIICIALLAFSISVPAQVVKVKPVVFDGSINVGYVNNGGYINFSGPGISGTYKNSKFLFGMLPSLRYKVDNGPTKNASIFPNLGVGFTYSYKYLSFQLPFYYNPKTTTSDGSWHLGFGVGFLINALNKLS